MFRHHATTVFNIPKNPRIQHRLLTSSMPRHRMARTKPYNYHIYQDQQQQQPDLSRKSRLLRSLTWTLISGVLGFGAAQYYQLWIYQKSSTVAPDSALDASWTLDVMTQIDNSPIVQAIKADPSFTEIWPLAISRSALHGEKGSLEARRHLIYASLRGTRGVFPRAFFCESKGVLCMVVGFGDGVEGLPHNVHGGMISTMVSEAMGVLAGSWFPGDSEWELELLDVNFDARVPARSICCVTVMPASTVRDVDVVHSDPEKYGRWPGWARATEFEHKVNIFMAYVTASDGHPLVNQGLGMPLAHAAGRFRVEGGDWPPVLTQGKT